MQERHGLCNSFWMGSADSLESFRQLEGIAINLVIPAVELTRTVTLQVPSCGALA